MSRRSARRERRQAKREKNKKDYTMEDVATNSVLYKSFWLSCKQVMFKESVQRYRLNLFFKNYELKEKMLNGEDVVQKLISFWRFDRGKARFIQSMLFPTRVSQKAIAVDILQPEYFKRLIKENSASQKGKGLSFAAKVFEGQIREFLKKHQAGYILLIDFTKYFENIDHDKIIEFYKKNFKDERLVNYFIQSIKCYDKGLGLGSEISQFNAIIYLNTIDHYIKSCFKYYGRYMDDSYIIHSDKKELENFLEELKVLYSDYKVVLNPKKTKIFSFKQHFTFLKTRHKITDEKIVKKPARSCIVRERRRLKKQIKLHEKGVLTFEQINRSFVSWRGSMKHRNARKSVFEMEKLFETLRRK